MSKTLCRHVLVAALLVAGALTQAHAADAPKPLEPTPAVASPIAAEAMMLGAAWAGPRAVAVGEQGIVLLSDDLGHTSRQARQVPLSSTLTAVAFADARQGWAVGHWGAVLATADGGESWHIQRIDTAEDRPLFAVHFFDAQHGVAVGLWSLVLTTDDGGQTWVQQTLAPPPGSTRADANLLSLFADAQGRVYATGERGLVLRSDDRGHSWVYHSTGYAGSLWAGIALADGSLLVGGQRGSVYRSSDRAKQWTRVELDSKSSVTGFAADGAAVLLVGLDGLRAYSKDAGQHFSVSVRPDRLTLTAALRTPQGAWLMWSRHGPAPEAAR
ncbi:MAG: YCF48-related protein [Rhizobacter sp.]|nr:YCF48-related protein [Rhizobacter sp.]